MSNKNFITPYEFQKLYQERTGLKVSMDTVWGWLRGNKKKKELPILKSIRPSPNSKKYLIPRKAIEEFFNKCEK